MVGNDVASRGLDIPPSATRWSTTIFPILMTTFIVLVVRDAGTTGSAFAFVVNEKNSGIIRELRDMLEENDQDVPPWLDKMSSTCRQRGGGGWRAAEAAAATW
jgi:superfamily II DNA/RNA helicase